MRSANRFVALFLTLLAVTASACASSSHSGSAVEATGKTLASEILHAPSGYTADQTTGADGTMSEAVFAREAGGGSARIAGFTGGFTQIYNSQYDNETIEITLLRFASPARAREYLNSTLSGTLSLYAPTHQSYAPVPGAIEVVGTKPYQKVWARAVVATRGRDYMFLVYLLDSNSAAPFEYALWVKDQYAALS